MNCRASAFGMHKLGDLCIALTSPSVFTHFWNLVRCGSLVVLFFVYVNELRVFIKY